MVSGAGFWHNLHYVSSRGRSQGSRGSGGPKIVDVGGLNGPKPLRNPSKMVGRFAPHHLGSVFELFQGRLDPTIGGFRSRNRPDLKTRGSHVQAYPALEPPAGLGGATLRRGRPGPLLDAGLGASPHPPQLQSNATMKPTKLTRTYIR